MNTSQVIRKIQNMAEKEKLPIEILQTHTTWFDSLKEEGNPSDFIFTCFQSEDPSSAESENILTIAVSLNKGRAAHYRTAVADDDFELLEEYPPFKNESELLEILKQKSKEFVRAVKSAEDEDQSEDGDEESSYEMECPVCEKALCDEEGSFSKCKHLLLAWNSFDKKPSFVHSKIKHLLNNDVECENILEDEFLSRIREETGEEIELLESESGLDQCLTTTPTLYAIVKIE